jgi:hypothetical protein
MRHPHRGQAAKGVGAAVVVWMCLAASAARAQDRDESASQRAARSVVPWVSPAESNAAWFTLGMPPFASPLPPSVPLPPPLRVIAAVPPPEYGPLPNPWTLPRLIPERPTPPAPYRFVLEHPELLLQTSGGLRQGVAEYDRRVGVGPSGPVLAAVRRVGMSETATGTARFELLVDRSGKIQSVSLVGASENVAGWQRFAHTLLATPISGMRLAETAEGAWVIVDVSANNERSSGHRRFWDYGLTLAFDVADAGARTLRVVRATVASELTWLRELPEAPASATERTTER